jgi:hypothetical protein
MKCIQYPSVYFLLLFISFSLFLFTFSSISFLSFPFPLPFSLLNPYPSTSSRAKRKPRLERILLPPKDPAASRRQAMPWARLHRELPLPLGLLLTRRAACSRCCLTSCCGPPRRELPLPGLLLTCRAASKHRRPASCRLQCPVARPPADPPRGGLRSRHPQGQSCQARWRSQRSRTEIVFCGFICAKRLK